MKDLFSYGPETGELRWLVSRGRAKAGDLAGHLSADKEYYEVRVRGKLIYNHRIIWYLVHGEWADRVDHKNKNRTDNRLDNLRNVSHSINLKNNDWKPGASGLKGVWPKGKRFTSVISINGKRKYLGTFDTAQEAHNVWIKENNNYAMPLV